MLANHYKCPILNQRPLVMLMMKTFHLSQVKPIATLIFLHSDGYMNLAKTSEAKDHIAKAFKFLQKCLVLVALVLLVEKEKAKKAAAAAAAAAAPPITKEKIKFLVMAKEKAKAKIKEKTKIKIKAKEKANGEDATKEPLTIPITMTLPSLGLATHSSKVNLCNVVSFPSFKETILWADRLQVWYPWPPTQRAIQLRFPQTIFPNLRLRGLPADGSDVQSNVCGMSCACTLITSAPTYAVNIVESPSQTM